MDDLWAAMNRPDLLEKALDRQFGGTAVRRKQTRTTMIAVARRYTFRAHHHIEGLAEQWSEDHWHDYTIEVVAEAQMPADESASMVIDTDELDGIWEAHRSSYHSQDLNRTTDTDTTVEALAALILGYFPDVVREVTVWEDWTRWGRARR